MLRIMTTADPQAPYPDGAGELDQPAASGWGRVLDGLGIAAGLVLVAIVIDIFSDGRLISRRLIRRRGEHEEGAPGDDGHG